MRSAPATLTRGPVRRHLVTLTLPMIWGLLAMMGFNVTDTWFVAQLGADELAAMSFTFPVIMLLISLGIGLMAGTASVLARAIGEGDHNRIRRLTTDALLLSFGLSAGISVLGLATMDPVFRLLGAGDALLPLIRDYMTVWYAGFVFVLVPMVGLGAIRATGDAKLQSRTMMAAALVNLVLDPLLIFGLLGFPRLELQGAAIATVIARAVTLVVGYWALHVKMRMLDLRLPSPEALWASWRSVLHVGLPAAGTNVIIPLSTGVVVALLAQFGSATVAGFGAATRIEGLALVVFYALSSIIGPFVGQNLGARKPDRIRHALRLSALFCLALGVLTAVFLGVFAQALAGLFSDDATVVRVASLYLVMVPVSYGAAGIVMVFNAAFNGMGRPLPAVAISVTRMFVLYLPLAWMGARLFGVEGVFAAGVLANLVAGAIAYWWNGRMLREQEFNPPMSTQQVHNGTPP